MSEFGNLCKESVVEPFNNVMGDLPSLSVISCWAFSRTVMNFAGSFQIKPRKVKGVKPLTVYIFIFVCLITKVVYLEPVYDLTAEACIAALKRFISSRRKHQFYKIKDYLNVLLKIYF